MNSNRQCRPTMSSSRKQKTLRRRGVIAVLAALMMVVVMAMMALSIDVGYIATVRTDLQRAVDSAALAGVRELAEGEEQAQIAAVEYLARNPIGKHISAYDEHQFSAQLADFQRKHQNDYQISVGHWDPDAYNPLTGTYGKVIPAEGAPSSVGVLFELKDHRLFFGPALGRQSFNARAEAVAVFQPRDMVVVLDLSGSMNDDSEFASINVPALGRDFVESNLRQCWEDLGSPTYGTLEFQPKYMVVPGVPPSSGSQPQIHVEYRDKEVYVTSTKDLSNVVLELSNNKTQKFDGLSGKKGTFKGTGGNANKSIRKVWVKSGSNSSGDGPGYGERFDFSTTTAQRNAARKAFGLDSVAYPYPSGSWNEYIEYCLDSSSSNEDAGYRFKFGYMNLMNYWLEQKYQQDWTPDLWMCSAQPITAVKNAVDVFLEYVGEADTGDRVGLAVYGAPDGEGQLEQQLTTDLQQLSVLTRHTQAGQYHNYTNIGAGMNEGRKELQNRGRKGSAKLMVLLTDGQTNWVDGRYDINRSRKYVLDEAKLAAAAKIPIVTISLGAGADKDLMQQVADMTKGQHFNIPGGQSVADYAEQLREVFRSIASARPMMIVK